MMTMDRIGLALTDEKLTAEEKYVIKWQFNLLGDFGTALIGAIKLADDWNLSRLAIVFPTEVGAYLDWTRGDMGDRLRRMGLEL